MKKYIFYLSIFISCSSSHEEIIYPNTVVLSDKFTLDFEENPIYQSGHEAYHWGYNSSSFYFTAPVSNSWNLFSYDLKERTWSSSEFQLEGPNGLVKYGPIIPLNDTLAFHPLHFGFQLIDLKSNQAHKYEFNEKNINVSLNTSQEIYFDGKVVGFPLTPFYSSNDLAYTAKAPLYGTYDLEKKELTPTVYYPEEFKDKIYSSNFLNHTFFVKGDTILLNFAKSHHLYGYDLNGSHLFTKETMDSKVNVKHVERRDDPVENMIATDWGGNYTSLIYDPSTHLYYRIARTYPNQYHHQVPKMDAFLESTPLMKLSLMALDSDFNVIAKDYFSPMPGVGIGDGLYFANENGVFLWYFGDGLEDESIENFIKVSLKAKTE